MFDEVCTVKEASKKVGLQPTTLQRYIRQELKRRGLDCIPASAPRRPVVAPQEVAGPAEPVAVVEPVQEAPEPAPEPAEPVAEAVVERVAEEPEPAARSDIEMSAYYLGSLSVREWLRLPVTVRGAAEVLMRYAGEVA